MISIWDQTIRVIVIGDEFKSTIKNLRHDYPYYIRISKLDKGEIYSPEESDMIVILLVSDVEIDSAILTAKTIHNMGKLTLIIAANPSDAYREVCDGWTIAKVDEINNVVEAILLTIIGDGASGLDQSEWVSSLLDCGHFLTINLCEKENDGTIDTVISQLNNCFSDNIHNTNHLLVVLYRSLSKWSQLQDDQLCGVKNFLECLPDSIDAQWRTAIDDTLESDKIKITAIATCKI